MFLNSVRRQLFSVYVLHTEKQFYPLSFAHQNRLHGCFSSVHQLVNLFNLMFKRAHNRSDSGAQMLMEFKGSSRNSGEKNQVPDTGFGSGAMCLFF